MPQNRLSFFAMYQKFKTAFRASRPVVGAVNWSKAKSLAGFKGVSLHAVARFLYAEIFMNPLMMTRANSIAFSFFMSLFPAFLVLFSLIPFAIGVLPIEKNQILKLIQDGIGEIMPNDTGEMLYKEISKFLKTKRSDFLSVGFVLSIFFSSNGLMALMSSFEKNYSVFRRRKPLEKRLRAIAMTFMLGGLLVVSTVLVILGNQIFSAMTNQSSYSPSQCHPARKANAWMCRSTGVRSSRLNTTTPSAPRW